MKQYMVVYSFSCPLQRYLSNYLRMTTMHPSKRISCHAQAEGIYTCLIMKHQTRQEGFVVKGPGYKSAKNAVLLTPSDTLVFARLHERC